MRRDVIVGVLGAIMASYFIFRSHFLTSTTYRRFEISPLLYKPDIFPVDTKRVFQANAPAEVAKLYEPKYMVEIEPSVHQDSYTLDTYMELPLETEGKTADMLYNDIEEDTEPIQEPIFVKYVRFHCTAVRNSEKGAVHIGGFRFFQGAIPASTLPIDMWNPHDGAVRRYTGGAWSDSDQRIAVFRFSEPVVISKYEMKSSNESPDFDPVHWKFEGSMSGIFWTPMDDRTGSETAFPKERGTGARYMITA